MAGAGMGRFNGILGFARARRSRRADSGRLGRLGVAALLLGVVAFAPTVEAQNGKGQPDALPSIAVKTSDFELKEGFFDVYTDPKTGEAYLAIDEARLGDEFISFSYTENGVLEAGHFRGAYRDNRILAFERAFDALHLVNRNTRFYFDPENPLARASNANVSDAVLAALPIVAEEGPAGAKRLLVRLDGLLLTDALHPVAGFGLRGPKIAKDRTGYREIRNYPQNTDFIVNYVFASNSPRFGASDAVADPRSLTVTMQHSFIALPEDGFETRLDDYRVGYFSERVTDLTSDAPAPYRDLINRWRLEKKDPDAPRSDPVKPITWWIENTTPLEYRETIREAALTWNQAFETAGFTNAIEVKVQPDDADWDAGDIRYNVLRWTSSPIPPFGGYGPSFTNPRTGEILGADIMLEYSFLTNRSIADEVFGPGQAAGDATPERLWRASARTGAAPDSSPADDADEPARKPQSKLRNLSEDADGPDARSQMRENVGGAGWRRDGGSWTQDEDEGAGLASGARAEDETDAIGGPFADLWRRPSAHAPKRHCSMSTHMSRELAFGRAALQAAGASEEEMSRMVKEGLYYLIIHEIGHTLGLNHNMKASSLYGPREVHDASVTQGAPTASIMDYPAINIAPPGVAQGDYSNTRPGPYDDWAIEFGYQPSFDDPEADERRRAAILARAALPENAFGNDADDMRAPGRGVDPRVMIGDMSSDPVAYAVDRMSAVDAALADMVKRYRDENSWQGLVRQYSVAYRQRATMAGVMARQVGGVYVERRNPGQYADGEAPYTPVPIERQKAAIKALGETVFAGDALFVPQELAARLQPQRRGFDFIRSRNEDPKIHIQAFGIQRQALAQLTHPAVMQRLSDTVAYGNEYSPAEMLTDLNDKIIGADLVGRPNTFRQNLQIVYVQSLIFMARSPFYDPVSKSAALVALEDIRGRMGWFNFWLPAETRAHRRHIALLLRGS